jgi:hypothetical protein
MSRVRLSAAERKRAALRAAPYRESRMSEPPARRDASDVDAIAATTACRELIERMRRRIRESQARATRTLNVELLMLYWSIGRDILAQRQASQWGDGVVGRIAEDLSATTGPARGSPGATSSTCAASPRSGPNPRKCHR